MLLGSGRGHHTADGALHRDDEHAEALPEPQLAQFADERRTRDDVFHREGVVRAREGLRHERGGARSKDPVRQGGPADGGRPDDVVRAGSEVPGIKFGDLRTPAGAAQMIDRLLNRMKPGLAVAPATEAKR